MSEVQNCNRALERMIQCVALAVGPHLASTLHPPDVIHMMNAPRPSLLNTNRGGLETRLNQQWICRYLTWSHFMCSSGMWTLAMPASLLLCFQQLSIYTADCLCHPIQMAGLETIIMMSQVYLKMLSTYSVGYIIYAFLVHIWASKWLWCQGDIQ